MGSSYSQKSPGEGGAFEFHPFELSPWTLSLGLLLSDKVLVEAYEVNIFVFKFPFNLFQERRLFKKLILIVSFSLSLPRKIYSTLYGVAVRNQ